MEKYLGVKLVQAEFRPITYSSGKCQDGYRVIYPGGYDSWSPKDVFEKAYRKIDNLTFGLTIEALKKGFKARRKGWNGKGIFIMLQSPDKHSKMTHPYIYIDTTGLKTSNPDAPKDRVPWLASQTDILAEDWEIFN